MKLVLRENPREWQKFAGVMGVMLCVIAFLLWRRDLVSRDFFLRAIGLALGTLILSLIWPKPFRRFYRVGMTLSFYVGQVLSILLLTLFFLLVVTPLGLGLRLIGKDLLATKRRPGVSSYWSPAPPLGPLDRQF